MLGMHLCTDERCAVSLLHHCCRPAASRFLDALFPWPLLLSVSLVYPPLSPLYRLPVRRRLVLAIDALALIVTASSCRCVPACAPAGGVDGGTCRHMHNAYARGVGCGVPRGDGACDSLTGCIGLGLNAGQGCHSSSWIRRACQVCPAGIRPASGRARVHQSVLRPKRAWG